MDQTDLDTRSLDVLVFAVVVFDDASRSIPLNHQ